jgi:5-methylcytosine-specific restriction endonuclease McrA
LGVIHKHQARVLAFAKSKMRLTADTKAKYVAAYAENELRHAGVRPPNGKWPILEEFYKFHHGGELPDTSPLPVGKKARREARSNAYNAARPCWAKPVAVATVDANSDAFLRGFEWRRLRMSVLVERGARCECCGASAKDGVRIHVDHIKPRSRYPELALTKSNLQVLCAECNHGKGSLYETDWRESPTGTVQ